MVAFATVPELANFIGDASLNVDRAGLILDLVSDEIRAGVGWNVNQQLAVTETLNGDGKTHLFLPTRRLTAVTSVTEDGAALVESTDYTWRSDGTLTRVAGDPRALSAWLNEPRSVAVVFDHGYPDGEAPSVFRAVTLDHAAMTLANPGGVLSSEAVDDARFVYRSRRTDDQDQTVSAGDDPRLDLHRILAGLG